MGKAWPALDIHVPSCDPQLQELVLAELDDFQPTAIQEPDDTSRLRAFFTSPESRDAAAHALAASFGVHLFVASIDVDDDDWAARSQAQLRAITIGRVVVAPPWDSQTLPDSPTLSDSPTLVVIQPSMGFGTGHHATTRLMLKALQEQPVEGRTVLDIGCGSGVLAIAAVKLGARSATGIDIDPDALDNERENAALNDVDDRVRFELGDFREMHYRADVVMANLTGGLLERSAEALAATLEPGGTLMVSGFMESETSAVLAALEKFATLASIAQEDEWMCATLVGG
ncbi:MAG TPA: 50S ribosomal protein L11 methyltransferase [Vicinamibacterales bacterium]|nr:50S ribosomal protein L11 methyltransferase [Vicinamibacterales bacterium]